MIHVEFYPRVAFHHVDKGDFFHPINGVIFHDVDLSRSLFKLRSSYSFVSGYLESIITYSLLFNPILYTLSKFPRDKDYPLSFNLNN
jgi:hypothetical protein